MSSLEPKGSPVLMISTRVVEESRKKKYQTPKARMIIETIIIKVLFILVVQKNVLLIFSVQLLYLLPALLVVYTYYAHLQF